MKRPRPSTVEKIKAKQAASAAPQINLSDVENVIIAARRALGGFRGIDLVNIAGSIANLEAVLAALQPKPAAPPPAPPAAPPAEPPKG